MKFKTIKEKKITAIIIDIIESDENKNMSDIEISFKNLLESYEKNPLEYYPRGHENKIWLIKFILEILKRLSKKIKGNWDRVTVPKEALEQFIRRGFNFSEIGKFYNVSRETISKRVKGHGLTYLIKEGYDKKVDKGILKKLVEKGANINFISNFFDVQPSFIYNLINKWGMDFYHPSIGKGDLERLIGKKTIAEISTMTGLNRSTVVHHAKKFGLWDRRKNQREKCIVEESKPL